MFVYMVSNMKNGTIYIGVTSDLQKRIYEHKSKEIDGFTKKYDLTNLVYFEMFDDAENAIRREKQFKKWNRDWKIDLIEKSNPNWNDLYPALFE